MNHSPTTLRTSAEVLSKCVRTPLLRTLLREAAWRPLSAELRTSSPSSLLPANPSTVKDDAALLIHGGGALASRCKSMLNLDGVGALGDDSQPPTRPPSLSRAPSTSPAPLPSSSSMDRDASQQQQHQHSPSQTLCSEAMVRVVCHVYGGFAALVELPPGLRSMLRGVKDDVPTWWLAHESAEVLRDRVGREYPSLSMAPSQLLDVLQRSHTEDDEELRRQHPGEVVERVGYYTLHMYSAQDAETLPQHTYDEGIQQRCSLARVVLRANCAIPLMPGINATLTLDFDCVPLTTHDDDDDGEGVDDHGHNEDEGLALPYSSPPSRAEQRAFVEEVVRRPTHALIVALMEAVHCLSSELRRRPSEVAESMLARYRRRYDAKKTKTNSATTLHAWDGAQRRMALTMIECATALPADVRPFHDVAVEMMRFAGGEASRLTTDLVHVDEETNSTTTTAISTLTATPPPPTTTPQPQRKREREVEMDVRMDRRPSPSPTPPQTLTELPTMPSVVVLPTPAEDKERAARLKKVRRALL